MYTGDEIMRLDQIKQLDFNPDTILDIGAHTGQFYGWAKQTWPNSVIWMIEANDVHEQSLKAISDNYVIAMLGDENKDNVNFYTRSDKPHTQGASFYEESEYGELSMIIPKTMKKLDDIFDEDTTFELIKIDTQGSELDIIRGGRNLCKQSSIIILEVSYVDCNIGAPMAEEVIEFMGDFGFTEKMSVGEHYSKIPKWDGLVQKDLVFFNRNKWRENK